MFSLKCDQCNRVVKDEGPWNFGLKEYPCWCGGTLTNKVARYEPGDLLVDIAAGFILDIVGIKVLKKRELKWKK